MKSAETPRLARQGVIFGHPQGPGLSKLGFLGLFLEVTVRFWEESVRFGFGLILYFGGVPQIFGGGRRILEGVRLSPSDF